MEKVDSFKTTNFEKVNKKCYIKMGNEQRNIMQFQINTIFNDKLPVV